MTDTREATPRGWKYVPQHVAEGPSEVRHPDGWLICTTPSDDLAALIVRAVNHFDEVVEVLRILAAEADEWGDAVPDDHRPVYVEMDHWDARYYGSPSRFTVGDLRRIRALLSKLEASHDH